MFVFRWIYLILVRVVLIVAGLAVVPAALPFRRSSNSVSDGRPILVLPKWAWLWSNDFDGALGDKRGWWDKHAPFGLSADHVISMFWWLAIRNPVNNLRRTTLFSCPVSECLISWEGSEVVEDDVGFSGWQLVEAEHDVTGDTWHGFYLVWPWGGNSRALVIRVGFKIKPEHNSSADEPPKGFTVRFNPWKKL